MSKQIIEAINTPSTYQFDGDTAQLRLYATSPFVTSDGQLIGQGSSFDNQSWYLPVTCTVQPTGILYVPSFEVDSTTDGQPRTSKYIAALFTEAGAYIGPMPTTNPNGFAIPPPSLMPSPTWGQLAIYNRLPTLLYPPTTFPTSYEMYTAIAAAISQQLLKASATDVGNTALSVDPTDPAFPIALGINDPNYLALLQLLIAGGGGFDTANGFYNIADPQYGFNLDGETSDSQAWLDLWNLIPDGAIIFIPPDKGYRIALDENFTATARKGVRVTSLNSLRLGGGNLPYFIWRGTGGGIAMEFTACYGIEVDGVGWEIANPVDVPGVSLDRFWAFDGNPTGGSLSSQNTVHDCSGTMNSNEIDGFVHIYFSETANQNNEFMQAYNLDLYGTGRATLLHHGTATASDNTLPVTDGAFTSDDIGKRIRVCLAGTAGAVLDTTIASINSATSVEMTAAAVTTAADTRVFVGESLGTGIAVGDSQNALHMRFINNRCTNLAVGIDIHEGSGVIDLLGGGSNDLDIRIRRSLSEGWRVIEHCTEGSMQACYQDSGDQISPLHWDKGRGSNDYQLTEGWMVLSGTVYMDGTPWRVAPPYRGKLLRKNGSLDLFPTVNYLGQDGIGGPVDFINSGYSSANRIAGYGDKGVGLFDVIAPFWHKSNDTGPFVGFGTIGSGGELIPSTGSVIDNNFASTARALEAARSRDCLSGSDGAWVTEGGFRPFSLRADKVGTHGGAAEYAFSIVGVMSNGTRSLRSYAFDVSSVANTLSGTNFLHVEWPSHPEFATYQVWLQNPANAAQGWQLATGVTNSYPNPSVYNLTSNPSPSFASWTTPVFNESLINNFPSLVVHPNEATFTDLDATPSVRAYNRFIASYSLATDITTFDDAVEGQWFDLITTNTNITFKNGTIKTNTGSDVVSGASRIYRFEKRSSNWYMF